MVYEVVKTINDIAVALTHTGLPSGGKDIIVALSPTGLPSCSSLNK